jgi:outer membrane protein TolC
VRIYKKKEKIALAEHLPSVALTANYLVTNPNSFNGFKNDFGGMFNVGVAVQVPISGWWEGTYKRNAARAETHIKQLELDDAKEKIELQVNQSVYKVNEAGKKLTASSRNKEKAEENLRHATIGFEEGVIPALNLMEAQTAWVEAQSDLIDAQIEVKLTDVYLSKALGRLSTTSNNK